jgi:hypothetical protein
MRSCKDKKSGETRVELKYCEHCGALWVREGGGGVYCVECQPKVADLPVPKKKPGRVELPVGPITVVDEYDVEEDGEESLKSEAAGGVA